MEYEGLGGLIRLFGEFIGSFFLMAMFAMIIAIIAIGVILIIVYIFKSIALFKIAEARHFDKKDMSWIPICNDIVLSKLAFNDYKIGIAMIVLQIITIITFDSFVPGLSVVALIAYIVLYVISSHKIYKQKTNNCVVLTIISALTFGLAVPFILFAIRKKEDIQEINYSNVNTNINNMNQNINGTMNYNLNNNMNQNINSGMKSNVDNKNNKIIVIIVIIIGIIVFGTLTVCAIGWFVDTVLFPDEVNEETYSINEINNMFISNLPEYSSNEISEENIIEFNKLLTYIDEIIGKDNYYIGSLYEVDYSSFGNGKSNGADTYVIKVIPKKYLNDYNAWTGISSQNPYIVVFSKDTEYDSFDNYYQTLLLGLEYKDELTNHFSNINSKYKYLVDYNTFLHISASKMNIDSDSTWEDGLSLLPSYVDRPTMLIIVPNNTSELETQNFINQNTNNFNKYYVDSVEMCVLKENVSEIDYDNVSRFSSIFNNCYSYNING